MPAVSIGTHHKVVVRPHTRTICVDLDGTLIAADLLWESLVALFKRSPLTALVAMLSIFRGRAQFKKRVALDVQLDPAALPYRQDLLAELKTRRDGGARLVLATASDETFARRVAAHLRIFDEVMASDGRTNLSGSYKAARLVERFGEGNFDYIGNDWSDIEVWRTAAERTIVAPSGRLARYARATS